jgi:hypothetical protein
MGELLATCPRCGWRAYLRTPLYLIGLVIVVMFLVEL